jgi:hypothetical protein
MKIKGLDEDSLRGDVGWHDQPWNPHSGNTLWEDNAIICTCLWTIHISITRTNTAPIKIYHHGFLIMMHSILPIKRKLIWLNLEVNDSCCQTG